MLGELEGARRDVKKEGVPPSLDVEGEERPVLRTKRQKNTA
jgi:hypothetical protein